MNVAKRAILNMLRRLGFDLIAVPAAHEGDAFPNTAGITKMVDEQRDLPDRITVYNLNGHAVVVKIS